MRLIFQPRSNDHMTLPIVRETCVNSQRVEFGDQTGAIKIWPGESLHHLCDLGAEAMLARFKGSLIVLVLTADTRPRHLCEISVQRPCSPVPRPSSRPRAHC